MDNSGSSHKKRTGPITDLRYEELVEIVRLDKRKTKRKNDAYNEIEKRIKVKIIFIAKQFYIPGLSFDDVLQESLYALRFKAIPDYDGSKGRGEEISPFDSFAILCVRRHLSTVLKSSFQNKRRALNTSISLDQDRGDDNSDSVFLSDILPQTKGTVVDELGEKEYYKKLFGSLYARLSKLEKRVFILYTYRFSYDEITDTINKTYKKQGSKKRVNIKSVDNALSRVKTKAKEIYKKYKKD